jgi:FG-GAP-like repeat
VGAYPQVVDWNNDGKKDLLAGDSRGQVWIFINNGTQKMPRLEKGVRIEANGNPIQDTQVEQEEEVRAKERTVVLTDPSTIRTETDSEGQLHINITPERQKRPLLEKKGRLEATGGFILRMDSRIEQGADGRERRAAKRDSIMGKYAKVHFGDWDGDGLKDLLVGQDGSAGDELVWYKNIGTKGDPSFTACMPINLPPPRMKRPSPYLVDLDGDGKPDLLCGTDEARIYYFRNKGSANMPEFEEGKDLGLKGPGFEKGYRCRMDFVDWNNDGKWDILVGNIDGKRENGGGNIWLFLQK